MLSGRGRNEAHCFLIFVVTRTFTTILLIAYSLLAGAQTVVTGTNYTTTELECVSAFVAFPDGTRYFSGLVVKQGTRLYYLNSPYTMEVIANNRIVFDDPDPYTDLVTVYQSRTAYADMNEFKAAAVGCMAAGGVPDVVIDSISYYGDTLYVYAGGNPIPWTAYIDSCPCEEPVPPNPCVLVLGEPETGEVWGNPATGEVWYMGDCEPAAPLAYAMGEPDTGEVWGNEGTGQVWGWTN